MVNLLDGLEGEDSNLVGDSLDLKRSSRTQRIPGCFSVGHSKWLVRGQIHNYTSVTEVVLSKLKHCH
jgi:hypothetical protein